MFGSSAFEMWPVQTEMFYEYKIYTRFWRTKKIKYLINNLYWFYIMATIFLIYWVKFIITTIFHCFFKPFSVWLLRNFNLHRWLPVVVCIIVLSNNIILLGEACNNYRTSLALGTFETRGELHLTKVADQPQPSSVNDWVEIIPCLPILPGRKKCSFSGRNNINLL